MTVIMGSYGLLVYQTLQMRENEVCSIGWVKWVLMCKYCITAWTAFFVLLTAYLEESGDATISYWGVNCFVMLCILLRAFRVGSAFRRGIKRGIGQVRLLPWRSTLPSSFQCSLPIAHTDAKLRGFQIGVAGRQDSEKR